jgi:methanogenic corrinoid protein MtbC1
MSTPGDPGRARLVEAIRRAYTAALVRGDARAAERAIRDALDGELCQDVIDDEIINPGLRYVDRLSEEGAISVVDEHIATHISLRVLALQREAFRVAEERSRQRVLLLAPEGEHDVVGLEMAANLLLHAGFDVRFVGADVPLDALGPAVTRHQPRLVAFSVTMPTHSSRLREAIAEVRRADPAIAVLVGGCVRARAHRRDGVARRVAKRRGHRRGRRRPAAAPGPELNRP